jgi:hypothetical protein
MAISRLNLGTTNQVLVKAAAGQTTNLLELQNSSGTVVAGLNQDGVWSGTAKPGLVLLNTTSFSGVASQAVSSVFNSTYDNYKVELSITGNSAGPNIQLRFRDSGGDVSTALYGYRVKNFSSLGSGSDGDVQGRTQNIVFLSQQGLGTVYTTDLTIFSPNLASVTTGVNNGTVEVGNYYLGAFAYNANTQFTGFSIISSTGTITGKVSVYGFNL